MQQRLRIRARHAALHKQARKHAGNHAVGEVEAIDYGSGTAVALLKRKQPPGRRQPQRACQAKKRALFLVIVHHSGNPLARINRTSDLGDSDSERLGVAGGSARNRRHLERAGSGRSPTLATDQ